LGGDTGAGAGGVVVSLLPSGASSNSPSGMTRGPDGFATGAGATAVRSAGAEGSTRTVSVGLRALRAPSARAWAEDFRCSRRGCSEDSGRPADRSAEPRPRTLGIRSRWVV
jgi:hypothetical protein